MLSLCYFDLLERERREERREERVEKENLTVAKERAVSIVSTRGRNNTGPNTIPKLSAVFL